MNYFQEFTKHLLEDEKPSRYFNKLKEEGKFPNEFPYNYILEFERVEQNYKHHPEGNVWNHTMQVVDEAAKRKKYSKNPKGFMWAALFHDIGKITTTKTRRGWITSYDHDKVGGEMIKEVMKSWNIDEDDEFYKYVYYLVRLHMQILFIVKDNEFADYNLVVKSGIYEDIALLGICDRLGRGFKSLEEIAREENNINIFKERCENYIEKRKRMFNKYNIPEE